MSSVIQGPDPFAATSTKSQREVGVLSMLFFCVSFFLTFPFAFVSALWYAARPPQDCNYWTAVILATNAACLALGILIIFIVAGAFLA